MVLCPGEVSMYPQVPQRPDRTIPRPPGGFRSPARTFVVSSPALAVASGSGALNGMTMGGLGTVDSWCLMRLVTGPGPLLTRAGAILLFRVVLI